jgi:predicted  nucleic acid-binding Zn-ribbon protein
MYKKIFSAILFGVLTIASTSTFVSCKDYDDDIKNIQAQIDELNNKKIAEINSTIVELKNADAALQKAITDGDAATLAAAKTLIAEAIADCQKACKENLAKSQQEQDAKYDEAIAKVNQRVDDVIKLLSDQDGNIQQVGKDLKALSDKLANFESKYGNLTTAFTDLTKRVTNLEDAVKAQKAALDDLAKTIGTGTGSNGYDDTTLKQDIKTAGDRITTLEGKVNDLQSQLTEKYNELTGKLNTVSGDLDDLKKAHTDFVTETNNKLTDLGTQIGSVKSLAESTASDLGKLDVMFKILVNDLRSLVYMPKLYVDGIETIEYPYLKYAVLKLDNAPYEVTRREADVPASHQDPKLRNLKDYDNPSPTFYAPVWPIQYHMNPGNASTEFANIKGYYAYEAEVMTRAFYDTKSNAASTWGIVPADRWDNQYNTDDMIWNKTNGIMTIGLRIKNPEGIDNPGVATGTNHFPTDLEEDSNDPRSVKNVIIALQANSKKATADYAGAGKDTVITSDYAQVVIEQIKIEGIIWNTHPTYWNGKNERIKDFWQNKKGYKTLDIGGDGAPYDYRPGGTSATNGRDEKGDVCNQWVHVWDEPEEALKHPADIELFTDQEVNLIQYLGVHYYYEQNEPLTDNVVGHKPCQTWKYDAIELQRLGFVWVFDTLDYYISSNVTRDSRYAIFTDHTQGIIRAKNVDELGNTDLGGGLTDPATHEAVDREPLVRVRLYHFSDIKQGSTNKIDLWKNLPKTRDIKAFNDLDAKPVLDGYIRLHITRPELLPIEYPTEDLTFNLCNGAKTNKDRVGGWNWSMFSKRVLQDKLNNMEKTAFDLNYRPEIDEDIAAEVLPDGGKVYELVQYKKAGSPNADNPNEHWNYTKKTGADKIGTIHLTYDAQGSTNHAYEWRFTEAELEALTHHATPGDNGKNPATVEAYIHYTGHFYSSTLGDVDENIKKQFEGADWDDIFIKLTVKITRSNVDMSETKSKDEQYWYKENGSWRRNQTPDFRLPWPTTGKDGINGLNWSDYDDGASISQNADILYRSIANNTPYPEDGLGNTSRTVPWRNEILSTWDGNKIQVSNSAGGSKLYFAPIEYKIKALDGTEYVVTPRRGFTDELFDKFICKYVPGRWNNNKFTPGNSHGYIYAGKRNDINNPADIKESYDVFNGDLVKNNDILNKCAIYYARTSSDPTLDGVFSNDTLFAVKLSEYKTKKEYEPIAIIQNTSTAVGGQVVLLHEYVQNKWILDASECYSDNHIGEENAYAEACVNAVGYLTSVERNSDDLLTGKFDDKGNPLSKQLRSYVGVIASNKCEIANQMKDYKIGNFAVFQMAWERPINLLQESDFMFDAVNNADYIYVVDIVKLFDWRGTKEGHMWGAQGIPAHWTVQNWNNWQWLWAYYNVKDIIVDLTPTKVKTNLSQTNPATTVTMNTVSNLVELRGLADRKDRIHYGPFQTVDANFPLRTTPYDFNAVSENEKLIEYMGLDNAEMEGIDAEKARFGYIKYYNNGQNVDDFDVWVPITIVYDWGEILDQPVKIHIHYTRGN